MLRRGRSVKAAPTLGYSKGLAEAYDVGKVIGSGGNGVVRLATEKATGRTVAIKEIPKVLDDPMATERKRAEQIPYLKREVEVLLALKGTLNVANLEGVYEDETHVFLVLEHCSGGELLAGLSKSGAHYSDRTVASYMRAVLRTLAQCHAKRIMHRDIKPGNFLLLSSDVSAPLKAIDFGLAVFFDPKKLPIAGLNPEGTPWYLAPECCRAKWYPASDVWAVGVMACYLLTGTYPFLDRMNPKMPDLARTLRSICFEELDLHRKEFASLSEDARAFITYLLNKDPLKRPSAEDALRHPFLRGSSSDRQAGKPLDKQVVQRIQRFAASSLFKRTVLEHIAADLLSMHFTPEPTTHGGKVFLERSVTGRRALTEAERSTHGGTHGLEGSSRGDRSMRGAAYLAAARSTRASREGSKHGGAASSGGGGSGGNSTHGGDKLSFRGKSLAALASARLERSLKGGTAYNREGSRGGDRSMRGDRSVGGGAGEGSVRFHRVGSARLLSSMTMAQDPSGHGAAQYLPVATPFSQRLAGLFDQLQVAPGQKIDRAQLSKGLEQIGYNLQDTEVAELFSVVDVGGTGEVGRAELAAGLIDWKAFQDTYKDRWMEAARRAFAQLDTDGSGALQGDEISAAFASNLSAFEVDAALHQALLEASGGEAAGEAAPGVAAGEVAFDGESPKIDFDHFLALLNEPSGDLGDEGLYKFDDRLSSHMSRQGTMRGGDLQKVAGGPGGGESQGCACTIM